MMGSVLPIGEFSSIEDERRQGKIAGERQKVLARRYTQDVAAGQDLAPVRRGIEIFGCDATRLDESWLVELAAQRLRGAEQDRRQDERQDVAPAPQERREEEHDGGQQGAGEDRLDRPAAGGEPGKCGCLRQGTRAQEEPSQQEGDYHG